MLNTLIVGASGYAGAELVTYINRHPHMNITALTVSAQSNDAGKLISDLHEWRNDGQAVSTRDSVKLNSL